MGNVFSPTPVMGLLAAFSRHHEALDWARQWAIAQWGPIALESPRFAFGETDYYRDEMGDELKKTFFVFQRLIDPGALAERKLASNLAEVQFRALEGSGDVRPLNLDPGYLNESKLVLASTKDHAHRIYLAAGIYAEITLRYRKGEWQPWEWTYPDYRRDDFHHFFSQARHRYRQLKSDWGKSGEGQISDEI